MITDPEFYQRYGPWAVIAGASEGIGLQYAHQLAEKGLNLIMLARRLEPLEKQASLIRRRHHVEVIAAPLDLGSDKLAEEFQNICADLDIGLLVYNACYSVIGEFKDIDTKDHQSMLDVNCRGPMTLCHQLIPRLAQRSHGGIILMSSMSGFQGTAMVANYAATKAWNTTFAQGLAEELQPMGIDVLACVAGATSTPGFEQVTPSAKRSKAFPMQAEAVAREGLRALGKRSLHITGRINRAVDWLGFAMGRNGRSRFISNATRDMYTDV